MAPQATSRTDPSEHSLTTNGFHVQTAPEAGNKLIKWRGATFDGQSSPTPDPSDGRLSSNNGHLSNLGSSSVFARAQNSDVADFFNPEIFQVVLHNPTTSYQMLRFSQSRFCGENMEFLERVDRFNTLLDEMTKIMSDINHSYTSTEAPRQLNLAPAILKRINADIKHTTQNTLPAMELIFADAQESIEKLLATDVYPRFVKYQITMSAVRALSTDRTKYAGLGDCFCLTNPRCGTPNVKRRRADDLPILVSPTIQSNSRLTDLLPSPGTRDQISSPEIAASCKGHTRIGLQCIGSSSPPTTARSR